MPSCPTRRKRNLRNLSCKNPGRDFFGGSSPRKNRPGHFYGSTAQFGKKSQTGFLPRFKVWKTKESCMYFWFFKLKKWGKKTAETRRRNCAVLPKRKFPGRHRRVKICLRPGAQVLAHRKIHVCGLFALLYQTFRFFGNIPINAAWAAILAAHGLLKNHVIAHSSTHCSVLRADFAGGAFTPRPLLPPDVERGERSSPASSDSGSKRGTGIHPP